jgi:hypothetical protein
MRTKGTVATTGSMLVTCHSSNQDVASLILEVIYAVLRSSPHTGSILPPGPICTAAVISVELTSEAVHPTKTPNLSEVRQLQ